MIACTKVNPYYQGKGIQVFLNVEDTNNNNRKFEVADYLVSDHSILDNGYDGEGLLSVIAVNNDGVLDIAYTTSSRNDEYGLTYFLNAGGSLQNYESRNNLAYAMHTKIPGREHFFHPNKLLAEIPVNLHNENWIGYISVVETNEE